MADPVVLEWRPPVAPTPLEWDPAERPPAPAPIPAPAPPPVVLEWEPLTDGGDFEWNNLPPGPVDVLFLAADDGAIFGEGGDVIAVDPGTP